MNIPLGRRNKAKEVAGGAARKVGRTQKGTTYVAGKTALADIPRPQLDSELGSSQPVQIREFVPELTSSYQRQQAYARMMTDAGVDVSVRIVKTPVLGAEFFVEPYSDDPLDVLIADFVWENLAQGMSAPFINALEDILTFYEDGFSVLEKVYENRQWSPSAKGANSRVYTMLKKLAPRPAGTIKSIEYDNNGGPSKITQTAILPGGNTKDVTMDISKCMIFTFKKRGGDLMGKSILRTAYSHWYYKTHLYKIDAIQKERHGIGVPRGKMLQGANASDKEFLRTMLRNLRTNEESFIIEVPNIEVDFVELSAMPVDVIQSAEHHNAMILLNVMAQFMVLGLQGSSGGSRAVAGSGTDLFMKANKYVANYICQVLNMYLVPELVVWNFPTNNFPLLRVRNIGETRDLQMFGAALSNLFSQQALTPDLPTENWVRDVFDMPHKQEGAAATQATQPGQATNGSTPSVQGFQPGGGGNGSGNKGGIDPNAIKTGNVGKPPNAPQ